LTISQSWIISLEEAMGELGENFGLNILWEEMGEDALQSIPRRSYALLRQVTV
jgi:hypothetical protein